MKNFIIMLPSNFTSLLLTGGIPPFFSESIKTLSTLVLLIGGGLGVWGIVNLMEGYGNDNPGAKSQGMKQLMAGVGIALIGVALIPQLESLFTSL